MQHRSEHRRDSIKTLPLSEVQQAFVNYASHGTMNDVARAALIKMLDARVSTHALPFYQFEKSNAEAAMATGVLTSKPSINLPETSLLWAINLAYNAQSDPKGFYDGELWKQFSGVDGVAQPEKERLGFQVASTGLSGDTRIGWGKLGSSYYYDPTNARINLDLIMSLGVGFDVAAGAAFHEIGHSILTKDFGPKLAALDDQIATFRQKSRGSKLTPDEYKQLQRLSGERHFRYLIKDEAENNTVDRWTVNHGRRIRRDHVFSRNATEAVLVDGLLGDGLDIVNDTPENRFRNVKHAIRYSFFRNNGYFPDTEAGWRAVGINPDWIKTADGKSGLDALEELKELCGGKDGVENLQPTGLDAMQGKVKLQASIQEYSDRRNARIEEVYDRFIAHTVAPMLDKQQEKLDEQMQKKQQGQGQDSEGQSGDPSENQDSTPQKSQGQDSGGEDVGSPSAGMPGGEGGGGNPIQVEDVGEMPDVESGPNSVQPEMGKPRPEAAEDHEAEPGQSLDELEAGREARKEVAESEDKNSTSDDPSKPKPKTQQGFRSPRGMGGTSDIESKPVVGDWSDYQEMAIKFSAQIREQQRHIDQLRAKQVEELETISPGLTLLPEDGDMARLDRGAHATMVKKILRGQSITEDDAARFQTDAIATRPSNIDVVLLLDGSSSMHSAFNESGGSWPFSPIQAGMHAGCVLNEACKNDVTAERGTRFYMGLWGNETPMMLINPGDKPQEVGKRIAGLTQSHGWGTNLAPSIKDTTKQLAQAQKAQSGGQEKTGYSHYIVISDGGISDDNASFQTVSKFLDNCPLASVDFVIIENGKTKMDSLAEKLERAYPGRVAKHHHNSPTTVVAGIKNLLLGRIQHTPITEAVSVDVKRRALERAGDAMNR
ncbi:MAG: hypothetical protein ACOYNL_09450 [Rickettsiales bacterium]